MTKNEQLIHQFYQSFQQKEYQGMHACYHEEVVFSDPAFPHLHGHEARAMWHMFTQTDDIRIVYDNVQADDQKGQARWVATYTFSRTGRRVVNVIYSSFEFEDGKIIRHTDDFDFWKWSRMALGLPGVLLGWSPLVQGKVQKTGKQMLQTFMAKRDLYKYDLS